MASKAVKLKQKALSVVDSVNALSSSTSRNSCTITVKSSPPRTAAEMTKLSVRRGWMLKRNEQRSWQRRYCCLVPHTFLYYFESKDAEVPRGVIDLESYTDIGVDQGTGAIILGPGAGAESGYRKFYFRPEDGQLRMTRGGNGGGSSCSRKGAGNGCSDREDGGAGGDLGGDGGMLGEWLSGLHRERYKVVRDERDAYMNLQEEYMSQMQDTTSAMTEAESERGRLLEGLRAEHAAARAAARDGLEQARALFREEGLPPEEATSLPLPALLARVRAVASERRSNEERLASELAGAVAAATEARGVEAESRELVERLRGQAEGLSTRATRAEARARQAELEAARERELRTVADAALASCRTDLQAARVDAEQGQVNLGIMAGERRAALAKVAELGEQKRLLVREVKAARSSLAEASAVNRRLARAYESLDRSLRASAASSSSSSLSSSAPSAATSTHPSWTNMGTATSDTAARTAEAAAVDEPSASFKTEAGDGDGRSTSPGGNMGPLSPQSSAEASFLTGGVAEEWHEMHLASESGQRRGSTGSVVFGRGAGLGGPTTGKTGDGSLSRTGLQVRNLSTGDVDVVLPGGVGVDVGGGATGQRQPSVRGVAGAREWASTEGDVLAGGGKPSSLDNLGLKITQSFSSANWRWGAKGGVGGTGTPTKGQHPSSSRNKGIPAINEGATLTSVIAKNTFSPRGDGLLGSQAQDKTLGVKKSRMGLKTVVGTLGGSSSSGGGSGAYGAGMSAKGGAGGAGRGSGNPVPSISLSDMDGAESDRNGGDQFTPAVHGPGEEEEDEDEQEAAAGSGGGIGALTCRRCGGTVEGPLHSTCVCKVPQLMADHGEEVSGAPSSTVEMFKLKGVFKSLNGGVEAARQMLDSAIRQGASTNIGRPDPPQSGRAPSASGATAAQAPNTSAAVIGSTDITSDGGGGGDGDGVVAGKRGGAGVDADVVGTEGREAGGEGDGGVVEGDADVGAASSSSVGGGDRGESEDVSRLGRRGLQPDGDASHSRGVCAVVLSDDRRNAGGAVDIHEGVDASSDGDAGNVLYGGGALESGCSAGIGHATDSFAAAATAATPVAVVGDDGMGQAVTMDIGDAVTAGVQGGGSAGSVVVDDDAETAETASDHAVAESGIGADDDRLNVIDYATTPLAADVAENADITARKDSALVGEGFCNVAVISSCTDADDGVISGNGGDGFAAKVDVDKLTSQHRQQQTTDGHGDEASIVDIPDHEASKRTASEEGLDTAAERDSTEVLTPPVVIGGKVEQDEQLSLISARTEHEAGEQGGGEAEVFPGTVLLQEGCDVIPEEETTDSSKNGEVGREAVVVGDETAVP